EEAVVTVGRAGEKNITFEMFWVNVGGHLPCGFNVRTLPGNHLEVTLEQLAYKRLHTGQGALTTQIVPVAPIGTKGRMIVVDTTTGEKVEKPWTWVPIGGGGVGGGGLFSFIVSMLKRAIWNSKES